MISHSYACARIPGKADAKFMRQCSSLPTNATARIASKLGRPVTDLQTEARLDFLRAKALDVSDMRVIASLVASNTVVEHLDLTGNGFGADAIASLIEILRSCPSLQSLVVGNNNLRGGVSELAAAAAEHQGLLSLSLQANAIAGSACEALAAALATNPALQQLDLSFNAFGPVGGCAIARGLADNSTLTSLRFASCSVRAIGAKELSLALQGASGDSLRHLDLHECYIGADGTAALSAVLASNTTLQTLVLSDNNIGERSGLGASELTATQGLSALHAALSSNTTLRMIDMRWNGLDAAEQSALEAAVRNSDAGRASPLTLALE
eukprot:4670805-Pleurochrysis_carterae.AAC.5